MKLLKTFTAALFALSVNAFASEIELTEENLFDMASTGITTEEAQEFVQAGINIDALNEDGETALYIAALCDDVDSVIALLEAGADPTLEDAEGNHLYACFLEEPDYDQERLESAYMAAAQAQIRCALQEAITQREQPATKSANKTS